jgi:RNA polymerase sigma factor (TIGR02999 family)
MRDRHSVTEKLVALSGGRPEVWDELMPIVYDELKQLAHRHLRSERAGHTLSTTALVHEAYLKLINVDRVEWRDRTHFFAMASRAMRRILIDYARTRNREKRGGGLAKVPLDDAFQVAQERAEDLIALDEALTRLESVNERQCRVVECRFFGGMSLKETAGALGISVASVKRDWAICRAWLNQELGVLDS